MDNSIATLTGSKMVLDFVRKTRWTRATQGEVEARKRALRAVAAYSPRRERFLAECDAVPPSSRGTYVHPAGTATSVNYRRENGQEELTPAELVWLQRLPLDPQEVTHEDAARLAGMQSTLSPMKAPSSYQLVSSVWQPVKELHDLREAQQNLEVLQPGLPPVPESASSALAEALQEEHPDWPASAVAAHAEELLAEAADVRARDHARDLHRAESAVQQLAAAAADRVVRVKESA